MALLTFQKPDKVFMVNSTDTKGNFEFRPLEPGYGITIGNALRRVLLSSLEGYAIANVKIQGADHEFATLDGVVEDMLEIIHNLKQVRFSTSSNSEEETFNLTFSGKGEVKAGDMNKQISSFKVLNKALTLFNLDAKTKLEMTITVRKGRGYIPAEENRRATDDITTIAIDSIHTPIKNVKYFIDNYRIEQRTDFERLNLEIETDGSIAPKEALTECAKILISHFALFSEEKISIEEGVNFDEEEFDEEACYMRQLLKTKLIDMDLSVRALNCLKSAEVETLAELVRFERVDLLKFRNFGKKSLVELDELLVTHSLTFGMDLTKYKLDKTN